MEKSAAEQEAVASRIAKDKQAMEAMKEKASERARRLEEEFTRKQQEEKLAAEQAALMKVERQRKLEEYAMPSLALTEYNNYCPPRVAMFGLQRGEGAVMLSYNSTYTRSITNSPCTPPAPCTLDSISHSDTSPMHMCILLCAAS